MSWEFPFLIHLIIFNFIYDVTLISVIFSVCHFYESSNSVLFFHLCVYIFSLLLLCADECLNCNYYFLCIERGVTYGV